MSELKEKATKLKEISKKYGYTIKHTHALEILSQLEQNVNRHVALEKEKVDTLECNPPYKNSKMFNFENAPLGIDTPFFQGYVIEFYDEYHEYINYLVTEDKYLEIEFLMEVFSSGRIGSMRFMTVEEVSKPDFYFRFENDENPVPYKTLLEWINKRAKEENGQAPFLVVTDSDVE